MTRTLLLLTHQFPHPWGDTAFVRNEIDALAAEFDEVRIVSFWGEGEPTTRLPGNCTYLGSLGRVTAGRAVRGALSAKRFGVFLGVLVRAVRARRFRPRADVRAALVGMALARRLEELGARRNASEALTVYSFWGVDVAYALPWFVREQDAVAVRVHRYDLDEASEGYRPLRPAVLADADLVLTISDAAQAYARAQYRDLIDDRRILVRRLGVPGPEENSRPEGRGVHIVSASSVIPLKRTGLILDAIAETARRGHVVTWTHFGDGPDLAALRSRAAELAAELPQLTVVLPGRVPVQSILDHYRDEPVDVFLNLSTIEGVPVSVMEAASYGIPAVATDVGATAEIVGDARGSGILLPPDPGVEQVVDAVERVLSSPKRFDARRVWAERFDARRNARETASTVSGISRP